MPSHPANEVRDAMERAYREYSGRVRASLTSLLGDHDLAEDAMHEAFSAAMKSWPENGVPHNPSAWLISTGRFKAIDALRRNSRCHAAVEAIRDAMHPETTEYSLEEEYPDERLKLIFTCCHPAIASDARAALTLREVCGLTTEEIARAFLTTAPTVAQRIVRAKARIRDDKIPYRIPSPEELPDRTATVLAVVYLLYNEGYFATAGASLTRAELSGEAIRLGRLLHELLPEPEVKGLLALMLLQESRREARVDSAGELVLLEDQNRGLWDSRLIEEGIRLVEVALATRRFGPYTLQAAIAAVHAEAGTAEATDWRQIVALYNALLAIHPSPVVELNRAAALAMFRGAEAGLSVMADLEMRGELKDYPLFYSSRAELRRRAGRKAGARQDYERALSLGPSESEVRFIRRRLAEL